MCCISDPQAKREFLKKLGRRKTFVAWKYVFLGIEGDCNTYSGQAPIPPRRPNAIPYALRVGFMCTLVSLL